MRRFHYFVVDVFTRNRFGGNPLAVVTSAAGLSDAEMQLIAREFNFSETTFVLPAQSPGNTARVRIFNRTQEMPFAGHPNVGTAWVFSRLLAGAGAVERLRFEEIAGLVDVRLLHQGEVCTGAAITAPQGLQLGSTIDPAIVAACIQLPPGNVRIDRHAPVEVSVGFPFVIVEVDPEALDRAEPDLAAFRHAVSQGLGQLSPTRFSLFLYARADASGRQLRARMFSPLTGTVEDPATGSASAALAAFLAAREDLADGESSFVIEQGVKMGRPSEIRLDVTRSAGVVVAVSIAGQVVPVMEGELLLD